MHATDAPIQATLLDALPEALALADAATDVRTAAQALRAFDTRMRVVVVDAFDMRDEIPAAIGRNVQLYFAATDGHCWQVTADGRQAAGFFVAGKG